LHSSRALELAKNEAAFSIASVCFHDQGDEQFLIVGCAQGMTLHPRVARSCSIHTYKVVSESQKDTNPTEAPNSSSLKLGSRLELVHKTPVEDLPLAISAFQGRVLVGVGATLRLYDMGRKRLLRKCELRGFPTSVQSLQASLDRIVVSDAQESVHFVKYRRAENVLQLVADDSVSRHMTCSLMLDHDTVMGADKFGNVFVLRLPADASDEIDGRSTAGTSTQQGMWGGSSFALTAMLSSLNKVVQGANSYIGAVVTSLQKAVLSSGGAEVVIYSTIHGAIGVLYPLSGKDEAGLLERLELSMRAELSMSLVGRDHSSFRGSFAPVAQVIDGDLCEAFSLLAPDRQGEVADALERSPAEVSKRLEDLRNRVC
jgi:splicing factor 3B subunit 3